MTRRTRLLAIGAAAICLAAAVVALALRPRALRPEPVAEESASPGAVQVDRPVISHAEKGVPAWQLQLQRLEVSAGGETLAAYGVSEGLVYDSRGLPVVRVTADRISGSAAARNFELSGNVTTVSRDGTVFTTSRVKWIQQERRLHCPDAVTMRNKDAVVSATKLDYLVDKDLVVCPESLKMDDGGNMLMGRNLRYNIKTSAFELQDVQAAFSPTELRGRLGATAPGGQR